MYPASVLPCGIVFKGTRRYHDDLPTAIQGKQTGPLWEPVPSYPHFLGVVLATRGLFFVLVSVFMVDIDLYFSVLYLYARQHICYGAYMPRQFRPSVTRVYCVKMAESIIEILSLSDRPIILVFRHQGSLCKYKGGE